MEFKLNNIITLIFLLINASIIFAHPKPITDPTESEIESEIDSEGELSNIEIIKCGPENGHQSCPSGYCCSAKGFCGKMDVYCSYGCQKLYGDCYEKKPYTSIKFEPVITTDSDIEPTTTIDNITVPTTTTVDDIIVPTTTTVDDIIVPTTTTVDDIIVPTAIIDKIEPITNDEYEPFPMKGLELEHKYYVAIIRDENDDTYHHASDEVKQAIDDLVNERMNDIYQIMYENRNTYKNRNLVKELNSHFPIPDHKKYQFIQHNDLVTNKDIDEDKYIPIFSEFINHVCPVLNYYVIKAYLTDAIIEKVQQLPNIYYIEKIPDVKIAY